MHLALMMGGMVFSLQGRQGKGRRDREDVSGMNERRKERRREKKREANSEYEK